LRTDLRDAIAEISDTYTTVRYAGHAERLESLRRAVAGFHPAMRRTA